MKWDYLIKLLFQKILFVISILLFFFILYKNQIANPLSKFSYYLPYYILSLIFIFLSFLFSYVYKNLYSYFLIITLSTLFSLYIFEVYSIYKHSHISLLKKKIKIYEKDSGKKFDVRNIKEIYNDKKIFNNNIVIQYAPANLVKENINDASNLEFYPLSGVSFSETIMFCNELGYYPTYKSDRYGFNNPDSEWDKKEIEFLLIGDSLTHGFCVNRPYDLASVLRNLTNKPVLNLGHGGTGPLIQLATLKEYIRPNVNNIVWLFSDANDLGDLDYEMNSDFLKLYLDSKNYSQNLKNKQEDINIFVKKSLDRDLKKKIKKQEIDYNFFDIIKLTNLRNIFYSSFTSEDYINMAFSYKKEVFSKEMIFDNKNFRDVLLSAIEVSKRNESNFYFVHLPSYSRASNRIETKSTFMRDFIKSLNIIYIDIYKDVFLKVDDPLSLFPFRMYGHYNIEGYQKIAEEILSSTSKKK